MHCFSILIFSLDISLMFDRLIVDWLIDCLLQGFKNATTPQDNWGPALDENKKGRYAIGQDNKGFEADEKEANLENGIEMKKKNGVTNGDSITVQF